MATINTLKTRILNKYDLLANYSNFTPLKGEVCVAVIGEEATTNKGLNGDVTKKPIVGIKVGDGQTVFNDLPWIQAVAGDVSTFVKGIVDEAKFNQLVNTLITNANLASADTLAAVDARLVTAEGDITRLSGIVETGDDSNAKLRAAINAVLGTAADTADSNTVYGAKKYAEAQATAKANAAQSAAEATAAADAAAKVKALEDGKVKANADAIDGINAKLGSTDIGTDATVTSAIKALQDTVGTSGGNSLGSRVEALEGTVGDADEGLVKDVNDLKAAVTDTGALGSRVKTLEGEMDVVQAATAGYSADKTIASDIQAAKDSASAANTLAGENKTKVDTLIASDSGKSVRTIANEELAAQLLSGEAEADFKTLQELAAWIENHPEDASAMNAAIASVKANLGYTTVDGAEVVPETVDARIAAAIKELEEGAVADNTDAIDGAVQRIQALEDANGTDGATTQAIAAAKQEAIDTVVGTSSDAKTANTVYGAKAFATDAANTAKNEAIAAAKTETEQQIAALSAEGGAIKGLLDAVDGINTEIDAMDATFADTNAGVVTGLVQTDGKITSVTQRKVKAADLDETDVFVFYCGNATGYAADMGTVDI